MRDSDQPPENDDRNAWSRHGPAATKSLGCKVKGLVAMAERPGDGEYVWKPWGLVAMAERPGDGEYVWKPCQPDPKEEFRRLLDLAMPAAIRRRAFDIYNRLKRVEIDAFKDDIGAEFLKAKSIFDELIEQEGGFDNLLKGKGGRPSKPKAAKPKKISERDRKILEDLSLEFARAKSKEFARAKSKGDPLKRAYRSARRIAIDEAVKRPGVDGLLPHADRRTDRARIDRLRLHWQAQRLQLVVDALVGDPSMTQNGTKNERKLP